MPSYQVVVSTRGAANQDPVRHIAVALDRPWFGGVALRGSAYDVQGRFAAGYLMTIAIFAPDWAHVHAAIAAAPGLSVRGTLSRV